VNVADQNPATNGDETESSEQPKQKSVKRFIIIGVVAVLVVGSLLFWWRSTFYEDTDDAQINGHLIQISSRIAGQVTKIYVDAAKVNVPITGISTGSNLRSTFSDVEGAEAGVAASRQQLTGAVAQIAQADANYTKAKLDLERYKPLVTRRPMKLRRAPKSGSQRSG
jgi:membrane fusion protein (multidrug efflux system)